MVKPDWGIKRLCQSCGARYYDFLRTPIVCPNCGTTFDSEAVLKSRRARPLPVDDVKPKRKEVDADVEELDEEELEEEEEELEEDEEEVLDEDEDIEEEAEDEVVDPTKRLPDVGAIDDDDDVAVDVEEDEDDLTVIDEDGEEVDPDEEER